MLLCIKDLLSRFFHMNRKSRTIGTGGIVKVTPTSKAVGDTALFMVAGDLTPDDILRDQKQICRATTSFP